MKKIIISILCLLSISSITNASFGSPTSLNLYKNIDTGMINLQDRMEKFELEGGEEKAGILSEINKYAIINQEPACLDESKKLSPDDFRKIVEEKNVSEILNYLKKDCLLNFAKNSIIEKYKNDASQQILYKIQKSKRLTEHGKQKYSIQILQIYYDLFRTYEIDKIKTANIKAGQTYKISKIGLYADGDINNSGFDLITDIEDIDKIIFADVVDYDGEPSKDLDDALNGILAPVINKVNELSSPNFGKNNANISDNINTPKVITTPKLIYTENKVNGKNTQIQYACTGSLNNNGLSSTSLNGIISNINSNLSGNGNLNGKAILGTNNIADKNSNGGGGLNPASSSNNPSGSYTKVTDNSQWPCESFFCINIDFVTYQHSLFGGGENITIEYLLNRSNKHLSKYAATSLIPAKMGTNEFELGLKDLNLPDIFHLSVQVSRKPVPILDIEKQGTKDNTEYSAENLFKEYYKINGLDYNRRNDLVLLNHSEQDKQNVNNSPGLTPEKLLEKQRENDKIAEERQRKTATLLKAVESKVSFGITATFDDQFTELDKFTVGINDYVNNLYSLVKKLREIPIEY